MPSERGFHVWRFRPWSERCGGWRIAVSDLKTREDAWLHVLSRLGLLSEAPPQPLPPQDVKVSWADPEWF